MEKKKALRPVYRTSFCFEEALYDSPEAKEPRFRRRASGSFSVDLVRAAAFGTALLTVTAVLALALSRDK